jgi:hypothetical protein
MFSSPSWLSRIPRIGDAVAAKKLSYIGQGRMPIVDMHDLQTFREYVPKVPNVNYAWGIYGSLTISVPGAYSLCISSDDGCAAF